jgi:acyl-CoA synthetase (AMP-forming)/AMP-acid ligase II
MPDVESLSRPQTAKGLNVSDRLTLIANKMPDAVAVACPSRRSFSKGRVHHGTSGAAYATITFAELEELVSDIARGLKAWGVPRGTRLALLVKPGIEFVGLVFGLLRAGMVIVLVDPGLGRANLLQCLADAEPEGFVAIGRAHLARLLYRHKFPLARWNVTVGRRWFWGGKTLAELRLSNRGMPPDRMNREVEFNGLEYSATEHNDPAAIIFTSGSTGPPKGVLYTQQMFDTQVDEIQHMYGIEPGGVDLACFPLFALFNAAMGITTVLPEMDFSRPAKANPAKLIEAASDWKVTQAFASPAVWSVVSGHCARTDERIPELKKIFSCGAPVPAGVIRKTLACAAVDAEMHTPYGATECLPISTIEATEIITETAARTDAGSGVCVGRKFNSIHWHVIQINDSPIACLDDAKELPVGVIGELIVRGPQVSSEYAVPAQANAISKICDGSDIWHRTGDVGYFDADGRFWYCGRKSQRVETVNGPIYTETVEAILNVHPFIARSALVGVGARGQQIPVVIYELRFVLANPPVAYHKLPSELREIAAKHEPTKDIETFLPYSRLPVDVRHNAKINREKLAAWATKRLRKSVQHRQPPKL